MNVSDVEWVFGSLNALSAIAALLAVIVAFKAIRLQQRAIDAQVKPLLNIEEDTSHPERPVIYLVNDGTGTAVITDVCFERLGHQSSKDSNSLISVLDHDVVRDAKDEGLVDVVQRFGEELTYLRPERPMELIALLLKRPNSDIEDVFHKLGKQIAQTKMNIKFEDIFHRQKDQRKFDLGDVTEPPEDTDGWRRG